MSDIDYGDGTWLDEVVDALWIRNREHYARGIDNVVIVSIQARPPCWLDIVSRDHVVRLRQVSRIGRVEPGIANHYDLRYHGFAVRIHQPEVSPVEEAP